MKSTLDFPREQGRLSWNSWRRSIPLWVYVRSGSIEKENLLWSKQYCRRWSCQQHEEASTAIVPSFPRLFSGFDHGEQTSKEFSSICFPCWITGSMEELFPTNHRLLRLRTPHNVRWCYLQLDGRARSSASLVNFSISLLPKPELPLWEVKA